MNPDEFLFTLAIANSETIPLVNTPSSVYYTTNFTFCH